MAAVACDDGLRLFEVTMLPLLITAPTKPLGIDPRLRACDNEFRPMNLSSGERAISCQWSHHGTILTVGCALMPNCWY
jgi:hypothetical protein